MAQKMNIALLSDATLSEIAYGMENQDNDYVFCLNDGNVYPCEALGEYFDNPDDLEFEELPRWSSADGYRLMCAFAQSCGDANLRKKLNDVLNSGGHGIFKRFRSVLDTVQGATDSWYKFKDKRMNAYIRSWYRKIMANNQVSVQPLKASGDEAETGSLMVSYEVEHLEKLDQKCKELEESVFNDQPVIKKVLSAFTKQEAFCAYKDGLCGVVAFEIIGKVAVITLYYIEEKSRGIGLFEMLFDLMNRELQRRGVQKVQVLCPVEDKFEGFLAAREVKASTAYTLKEYFVENWNAEVDSQEIAYLV